MNPNKRSVVTTVIHSFGIFAVVLNNILEFFDYTSTIISEQTLWRREYLKENYYDTLEHTSVVDPEGAVFPLTFSTK